MIAAGPAVCGNSHAQLVKTAFKPVSVLCSLIKAMPARLHVKA
jgi:hypothetical protein